MSPCNHKKAWISLAHEKVRSPLSLAIGEPCRDDSRRQRPPRSVRSRPPALLGAPLLRPKFGRPVADCLAARARHPHARFPHHPGRQAEVSTAPRPASWRGGERATTANRFRRPMYILTINAALLKTRASPAGHSNRTWCGRRHNERPRRCSPSPRPARHAARPHHVRPGSPCSPRFRGATLLPKPTFCALVIARSSAPRLLSPSVHSRACSQLVRLGTARSLACCPSSSVRARAPPLPRPCPGCASAGWCARRACSPSRCAGRMYGGRLGRRSGRPRAVILHPL